MLFQAENVGDNSFTAPGSARYCNINLSNHKSNVYVAKQGAKALMENNVARHNYCI